MCFILQLAPETWGFKKNFLWNRLKLINNKIDFKWLLNESYSSYKVKCKKKNYDVTTEWKPAVVAEWFKSSCFKFK